MDATITFTSAEQASWFATMPQLVGNGHQVTVDGATATLTTDALEVLAQLPDDNDGHFDGTHVWIGGTEYRVTRKTGRPAEGKLISLRVPAEHLAAGADLAKARGIDRTELFRQFIADGLRAPVAALAVRVADGIDAIDLDATASPWTVVHGETRKTVSAGAIRDALDVHVANLRRYATEGSDLPYETTEMLHASGMPIGDGYWQVYSSPLSGSLRVAAWWLAEAYWAASVNGGDYPLSEAIAKCEQSLGGEVALPGGA